MNADMGEMQYGSGQRLPPVVCDLAGCDFSSGQVHDPHPISTIEMVLEGIMYADYRGKTVRLEAGDVILLSAGESHCLYAENGPFRKIFVTIFGSGAQTILKMMLGEQYVFHPDKAAGERIRDRMTDMILMLKQRRSPAEISTLLYGILAELSSLLSNESDREFNMILRFMESHLSMKLSKVDVAKCLHLPQSRLEKLFQSRLQTTPAAYFLHLRMKKAAELLNTSSFSIKEISSLVGYSTSLTFSREFRKHFGQRPSDFRKGALRPA